MLFEFFKSHIIISFNHNFRYSDKELRKLKEKAERKILINYILKNWYRIPKIMIERYNNMGLKKFKEHILSYFESYSFRKSGV
jgi:hypothetical protein